MREAAVEALAVSLTKPQQELLLNLAYPVAFGSYFLSVEDEQALFDAGLIIGVDAVEVSDVTPLGRVVATYLRAEEGAGSKQDREA